ncbi:MAG: DEAD/DEAH box helicase [Myxococcota bacterium]|nr:DEAD/DEAH box helicase [Myxococcota bacterium]
MEDFFRAVQAACSRSAWSRGVELARGDAVVSEPGDDAECVLRVTAPGNMMARVVTLYLDDEDWECSCHGQEDACDHVAAATIALRRARKSGKSLPNSGTEMGRLRYCFITGHERKSVGLSREIMAGDHREPLRHSLTTLATGRIKTKPFHTVAHDLKVERILGAQTSEIIPRERMGQILEALSECEDIELDGQPVRVSGERILPIAHVVDAPGGVRLYLDQDPRVERTFSNGVALCGSTLHALGDPALTGKEKEELPRGRFFSFDQITELVTEWLPSLELKIPVTIHTDCLPSTTREATPYIRIEVSREENQLALFPTLVYGSPPTARIDAGRLIHLEGPIPVRNEAEEDRQKSRLQRDLGLVPGRRITLSTEEAFSVSDRLRVWRGEVVGYAHESFHRTQPLEASIEVASDGFDIAFSLPSPDPSDDDAASRARQAAPVATEAVFQAWQKGESYVALSQGGFAPIPKDWFDRFGQQVADLLAAREESGEVPACALPDLGRLCEELDHPQPQSLEHLRPLLSEGHELPAAKPPHDLQAELRDYQRQGIDWLCFLKSARLGALLADDMGLGKTLQTLCVLESRSLVVVPTSLLYNWADEITRFRPSLRYSIYHGPGRKMDPEADVVLTSYAILRLEIDRFEKERWQCVVLDEAQNIKNPESQVAQAAFRLQADFRVALTGTPVENRLEELWSQLHFLNRGLLGGRKSFQSRYAAPISQGDADAAETLRKRLRPFILRRLKLDVAPELPPRSEIVLHCELSEDERNVYDAIRAAEVAQVVESLRGGGNVMAALEALLRLRQAACHSALVPGQSAAHSTKLALLVDRLEQAVAEGHKALVFSQWTSFLDLCEPVLQSAGLTHERLDGSSTNRAEIIRRFSEGEGAPVMLISLKAGGTGLNLTAADHVFLLDPWWNPAVEDQAADRAHRIGQTRPVVVHRLVARDTVEERILELHARKRSLSDAALLGDERGKGLTRDDLLALLD